MTIDQPDRIIEYAAKGYILIIRRVEDALYEWQIVRSDGTNLCEIEAGHYWLSLASTVEEGRAALAGVLADDEFIQRYAKDAR